MNYRYFKRSEFNCKCCDENLIVDNFIEMLDKARVISGIPYEINSGYRCQVHNKAVGGVENSSHMKGIAADIKVKNEFCRMRILEGVIKAGFKRIGIGKTYIHVDIDKSRGNSVWLY